MKTKSSTATAAPVTPAAGLKRINLAGIATTAPAAKAAKSYPELPDPDGQVASLVEGILEMSEQVEAITGALEISKGELIAIAKPFYFAHYSGQMAVASSVEAKAGDKLVRVGFSNSYRGTSDDAAILRVTGEKGAAFFKQSFELKIKATCSLKQPPRRSSANSKPCSPDTLPGRSECQSSVQTHQGIPHCPPHDVFSRREHGD